MCTVCTSRDCFYACCPLAPLQTVCYIHVFPVSPSIVLSLESPCAPLVSIRFVCSKHVVNDGCVKYPVLDL